MCSLDYLNDDATGSLWPAEEELEIEREALNLTLRHAVLRQRGARHRKETFWAQLDRRLQDEELRLMAQRQIWAQHRASREQDCLQPLSCAMSELRRWQGVQRSAHDQKCVALRGRREAEEGDLRWRIFCARATHDSCGALTVVPLNSDQTRYCDAAAAAQLQPRAKAKDPRVFTVTRAAAITLARPSSHSAGPASARSTRGLLCGELCQSASQLEVLLSRLLSTVLATDGAPQAGLTPANAAATSASPAASGGGGGGSNASLPSSAAQQRRFPTASRQQPHANSCASGRVVVAGAAGKSDRGGGANPESNEAGTTLPLQGKRLPLFPMSMRLSSECLGWLQAGQGSPPDRHVYYIVEEIDASVHARYAHRGNGEPVKRAFAEKLARKKEITAVTDVGVDLRLELPEDLHADRQAPRKQLHLRPAAVEHLIAVDCLWPILDAADRQVLNSCYTPRFSTQAPRLTTLYAPLCDGPHAEPGDVLGSVRRLRPLRLNELKELLHVYAVREPQQTSAVLALPAAEHPPAGVAVDANDEVLGHLYTSLTTPPGTAPGSTQCYLLQLQPANTAAEESTAAYEDPTVPPLVEMCQNGALEAALGSKATARLRNASLTPPTLAVKTLEAALAAAEKARSLASELTTRTAREANPPDERMAPSPGRHRGGASPGR